MIATGHGVVDGSLQAKFPGGVEYPDGLSRVVGLAGFIVAVKTDSLALSFSVKFSYEICTFEAYGENSFLVFRYRSVFLFFLGLVWVFS